MTKSTHQSNSAQHKESLDEKPGAIIGWAKQRSQVPFSQVANEFARSQTLSVNCIAILLYLMSHRDDWEIRTLQLKKHFKGRIGQESVYKALREACDAGYMRLFSVKEGNLLRRRYEFDRSPIFKESFPHHGFRDPGSQDLEGHDAGHIEKNTILEEEEEERPIGFGFRSSRKEAPEIIEPQAQEAFEILTEYPEVSDVEANDIVSRYTLEEIETQLKKIKVWSKRHGPILQWAETLRKFLLKAYGARNRCSAVRQ